MELVARYTSFVQYKFRFFAVDPLTKAHATVKFDLVSFENYVLIRLQLPVVETHDHFLTVN